MIGWLTWLALASAQTTWVTCPEDYTGATECVLGLQNAIDGAIAGDTIQLTGGAFLESVEIRKDLTLESLAGASLVGTEPAEGVIFVNGAQVGLHNLTISSTVSRGLFVSNGSATVSSSTFTVAFVAAYGSGVAIRNGSKLNVESSVFRGQTAGVAGGHMHIDETSEAAIGHSVFEDGFSAGDGGAISCEGCTLNIYDSEFRRNTANKRGGAILTAPLSTVDISNSLFELNTATGEGGAVCHATADNHPDGASSITVKNCDFSSNTAESGGALWLRHEATIIDSRFLLNRATYAGGGVAMQSGGTLSPLQPATSRRNLFCQNSAVEGAAAWISDHTLDLANDQYIDNQGSSGTGLYLSETAGSISNESFVGSPGSAVTVHDPTGLALYNSLFAYHSDRLALEVFDESGVAVQPPQRLDLHHNLWHGNSGGDVLDDAYGSDHVTGDPLFLDYVPTQDCHSQLLWGYPATPVRDAGSGTELNDADDESPADIGAWGLWEPPDPSQPNKKGGYDLDPDTYPNRDNDGDGSENRYDCAPSNSTISEYAVDSWYDGIDQNCDEANDYDLDGDGFETMENGHDGEDCDDKNRSINPDEDEDPDTEADDNCDGSTDADGDGREFPEDCGEGDAQIYPGAPDLDLETDRDCNGYKHGNVPVDFPGCSTIGRGGSSTLALALIALLVRRRFS